MGTRKACRMVRERKEATLRIHSFSFTESKREEAWYQVLKFVLCPLAHISVTVSFS